MNILFQKGRISESYYDEQYAILDARLAEYEKQEKYISLDCYRNLIKTFSGDWQALYTQLDRAHKQAFWKSTIRDIQIDKETHRISGFNFLTILE